MTIWSSPAALPKPQRIGLSATIRPLERVATFLSPTAEIVDVGSRREMDLSVEVPSDELGAVGSGEMWQEIYDKLAALVQANRTTLIFVPTRRMSERVAFALTERLGEGIVMPHHGSLSREGRFEAENRLKNGELRGVVATASLELGIDIGTIDLVVQLGSPRSIATALQRIGRSGHWVGAKPRGKIFATTRDELIECAALVRSLRGGEMDALCIPVAPLDILAQQMVAACATREWAADELYALVKTAYPYRDLPRSDFDEVVSLLADGVTMSRGRSGTYLHYDRVNGVLRARRGARMAAITCGGAIPDTANFKVVAEPDGHTVGTLDEDFAVESLAGDIFLLGTNSWRIRRVETGVVRVEDAHGAPPTIPFWNGEGLGRTIELSREVSELRAAIDERDDAAAHTFLADECALDISGAEQAIAYIRAAKAGLGVVPTDADHRCGAVLRRRRRDAADSAHAVRCADQPRVGTRAAQAVLRLVQLRTSGGGHRQRDQHLAGGAARIPAGRGVRVREGRQRREGADAGDAAGADVRGAVALERNPVAHDPAHARRAQSGRRSSCACEPTICSRPFFRIRQHVPRT